MSPEEIVALIEPNQFGDVLDGIAQRLRKEKYVLLGWLMVDAVMLASSDREERLDHMLVQMVRKMSAPFRRKEGRRGIRIEVPT